MSTYGSLILALVLLLTWKVPHTHVYLLKSPSRAAFVQAYLVVVAVFASCFVPITCWTQFLMTSTLQREDPSLFFIYRTAVIDATIEYTGP